MSPSESTLDASDGTGTVSELTIAVPFNWTVILTIRLLRAVDSMFDLPTGLDGSDWIFASVPPAVSSGTSRRPMVKVRSSLVELKHVM